MGVWGKPSTQWRWHPNKPRNLLFHVGETGFQYGRKWQKKRAAAGPTPDIRLPLYGHVLHEVVKGLIKTVHDNTMAAIFTIGMSIIFCIL